MRNVYEITRGNEKESLTTLFTFSAAGNIETPLIVYPYKRIPNDIRESVPEGFAIDKTDSGCMQTDVFNNYIKDIFYNDLVKRNVKFPVVLFVDGHASHKSYSLSKLCEELQIILVCLYPNSTRITQPADVSGFGPLKEGWKTAVHLWKTQNITKVLTKLRVAPILEVVKNECIDKAAVINGFEACGLYPFNPDAVDYSKCLGKSSTKIATANQEQLTTAELQTPKDSNVVLPNQLTYAIDLTRFKEIVGPAKFDEISLFDGTKQCSSEFTLLHTMYLELSRTEIENLETETSEDVTVELQQNINNSVDEYEAEGTGRDVCPTENFLNAGSVTPNFEKSLERSFREV